VVAKNKRLKPNRVLSVDTGIKGMLRRQVTTNAFLEQSHARKRQDANALIQQKGLPSINEIQKPKMPSGEQSPAIYSPTKYLKESLRHHGGMLKSTTNRNSYYAGGSGDLYEDFIEQNYREN